MVKHHPDDSLLTEYSAGSLDWGLSLCVAAHLHFCASCQHQVAELNSIGGSLLDNSRREETGSGAFADLMARIKALPQAAAPRDTKGASSPPGGNAGSVNLSKNTVLRNAPKVVRKLIPQGRRLKWKLISPSTRTALVPTGQEKYEVALHRISSGGKTPPHDHRGKEVTLVLQGSFSDADGLYSAGDFLVREPGQVHRPTATQNEDCICLTAAEAPVSVTGLMGKVINPLLTVRPG